MSELSIVHCVMSLMGLDKLHMDLNRKEQTIKSNGFVI